MIKAILVFNNHGKPRLSKFYHYFVSVSLRLFTDFKMTFIKLLLNFNFRLKTCNSK